MPSQLRELFVASAKGRVVDRLRRSPQTVQELASGLGVSANAVRAHLVALQRDRLVQRGDVRRGTRRPSHTYRLAPGAEPLFCQAYVPFLDRLLHVLVGRISPRELDDVVRAVGRRLATPSAAQSLASRVSAAAAVLDEMGGITEIETRHNGGVTFVIRSLTCPLGTVVRSHPSICAAIESLMKEVTRAKARERCHRAGSQPQCVIEIAAGPKQRRAQGRDAAGR
jgi:predicted ArsR family transcriptional regulator